MQIQERPSVGELIENTEMGDTAAVKTLLKPMFPRERAVIGDVLGRYQSYNNGIHKVAVFHALQDYFQDGEVPRTTQGVEDRIVGDAGGYAWKLECVENAITSPDKVVIRTDRSVDLGDTSSVLNGESAAFLPYGYEGVRNTTLRLNGDKKRKQSAYPILKASASASYVREHDDARWAIRQNAVEAKFEQWCLHLEKIHKTGTPLDTMIKKRHIMRIFNTYIDILSETESTFLKENVPLQSFISENRSLIAQELAIQLEGHKEDLRTSEDPDAKQQKEKVLDKYHFAISELFGGLDIRDKKQKRLLKVAFSMKI